MIRVSEGLGCGHHPCLLGIGALLIAMGCHLLSHVAARIHGNHVDVSGLIVGYQNNVELGSNAEMARSLRADMRSSKMCRKAKCTMYLSSQVNGLRDSQLLRLGVKGELK